MILGHHAYCAKLHVSLSDAAGWWLDDKMRCTCGVQPGSTGLRCISCKRDLAPDQIVLVARFYRVTKENPIDFMRPGGFALRLAHDDDEPNESYGICSSQCLMDIHRDVLGDAFGKERK